MEVLTLGEMDIQHIEMFLLDADRKDLEKINRKHKEAISRAHHINDLVPVGTHRFFYPISIICISFYYFLYGPVKLLCKKPNLCFIQFYLYPVAERLVQNVCVYLNHTYHSVIPVAGSLSGPA